MSNMKTATVRELQHNLARMLEQVRGGQEIAVTKRGEVVARIVPALSPSKRVAWPDCAARMRRLVPGGRVRGRAPSALVRELRGERV